MPYSSPARLSGILLLETGGLIHALAALRHANDEILSDDGTYYGEIPICNGVYANAQTLEACREELKEVLEEWIFFRVHQETSRHSATGQIFSLNCTNVSLIREEKEPPFRLSTRGGENLNGVTL